MDAPSLSAACTSAFVVVFLVLGLLALVIQLISLALPARPSGPDPALVAAIATAVAAQHPRARVVHILEAK